MHIYKIYTHTRIHICTILYLHTAPYIHTLHDHICKTGSYRDRNHATPPSSKWSNARSLEARSVLSRSTQTQAGRNRIPCDVWWLGNIWEQTNHKNMPTRKHSKVFMTTIRRYLVTAIRHGITHVLHVSCIRKWHFFDIRIGSTRTYIHTKHSSQQMIYLPHAHIRRIITDHVYNFARHWHWGGKKCHFVLKRNFTDVQIHIHEGINTHSLSQTFTHGARYTLLS